METFQKTPPPSPQGGVRNHLACSIWDFIGQPQRKEQQKKPKLFGKGGDCTNLLASCPQQTNATNKQNEEQRIFTLFLASAQRRAGALEIIPREPLPPTRTARQEGGMKGAPPSPYRARTQVSHKLRAPKIILTQAVFCAGPPCTWGPGSPPTDHSNENQKNWIPGRAECSGKDGPLRCPPPPPQKDGNAPPPVKNVRGPRPKARPFLRKTSPHAPSKKTPLTRPAIFVLLRHPPRLFL